MLKRHTVSTNKYVKSIADDFENFDKIAPHFVILSVIICIHLKRCKYLKIHH